MVCVCQALEKSRPFDQPDLGTAATDACMVNSMRLLKCERARVASDACHAAMVHELLILTIPHSFVARHTEQHLQPQLAGHGLLFIDGAVLAVSAARVRPPCLARAPQAAL